jgi:hypothetical protein
MKLNKRCLILAILLVFLSVGYLQSNQLPRIDSSKIVQDDKIYVKMNELSIELLNIIGESDDLTIYSTAISGNIIDNTYHDAYIEIGISDNHTLDLELYKEYLYEQIGAIVDIKFFEVPMPDNPVVRGVITDILKSGHKILVEDDTLKSSDDYTGSAYGYFLDKTMIIDESGKEYHFDDLELGMRVEAYSRFIVLESLPSISTFEKVILLKNK